MSGLGAQKHKHKPQPPKGLRYLYTPHKGFPKKRLEETTPKNPNGFAAGLYKHRNNHKPNPNTNTKLITPQNFPPRH